MNYKIAIPSHNRPTKQITYKYLTGLGFTDIDIFVSSKEQEELYREHNPNANLIVGVLGVKEIRNFMTNYYPEGSKIVFMDDDISLITMKNPRSWEESCFCNDELDLALEIDLAFKECEKSKRSMWGIYPVDNHFFMKNDISYDYKFSCGGMYGLILNRKIDIATMDQYDDYERCIKHYIEEGGIVRLNYLGMKTPLMCKNEGGYDRTSNDFITALEDLKSKYPNLVNVKIKKRTGLGNPVLKDTRTKTKTQKV